MTIHLKTLALCMSVLFITACSEDSEPATPENQETPGEFMTCRITSIARENFDDHTYTYNDAGKIISHVFGNSSYEYSYNGKITTIKWYYQGELQRTETVTNNDAGFAVSIKAEYENDFTPTRYTTFEYDGKNQLARKSAKDEGNTNENHTVYQWVEGNMVAESDPDQDNMITYNYSSKLTQPAEWFNEINLERGYVTIRNKNRLSKITNPNGTTYTHSYDEDDDGRIEAVTISPSNNNSYTKHYSFSCD